MVDYHKSEFLVSNSHSSICLDFLLMQIFIGKTLKLFILMFAKFEFHIQHCTLTQDAGDNNNKHMGLNECT